MQYKNKIQ